MRIFYQVVGVMLVVVLLAGCDGKKKGQSNGNVPDSTGCKADKPQLEKSLKDFRPETIVKGVKPFAILDVARLTNGLVLKTGRSSLPVGGGVDGYVCSFSGHSLAVFLAEYSRLAGKTVIQEVDEPQEGITFKVEDPLPVEEAIRAMESFLSEKMSIVILDDDAGDLKAVKGKTGDR
ncbi:MAG: hypothetical protein A2283_12925 [Lentisphaerae bacterium RIFOXYA12_FULL_48_11]|nr:MAG: hypothetical protein A2283_12925 [Lentisphaerae bacterium RIFOXYA12_FULL_48_11]